MIKFNAKFFMLRFELVTNLNNKKVEYEEIFIGVTWRSSTASDCKRDDCRFDSHPRE